jgi:hypothetical protein
MAFDVIVAAVLGADEFADCIRLHDDAEII